MLVPAELQPPALADIVESNGFIHPDPRELPVGVQCNACKRILIIPSDESGHGWIQFQIYNLIGEKLELFHVCGPCVIETNKIGKDIRPIIVARVTKTEGKA